MASLEKSAGSASDSATGHHAAAQQGGSRQSSPDFAILCDSAEAVSLGLCHLDAMLTVISLDGLDTFAGYPAEVQANYIGAVVATLRNVRSLLNSEVVQPLSSAAWEARKAGGSLQ
jgi:hypothetical protein